MEVKLPGKIKKERKKERDYLYKTWQTDIFIWKTIIEKTIKLQFSKVVK